MSQSNDSGCAILAIIFVICLVVIVGVAVAYTKFINPPPVTDAVQRLLDSCDQTWYTKSATWEGLNGTLVLECKE
jgi:hypothetical protein